MNKKLTTLCVVGIALAIKDIGDTCITTVNNDNKKYYLPPQATNFNCQVNAFNQGYPETNGVQQETQSVSIDHMTAASGTSGTLKPY